ncbi:hypothetical protein [Bradymonas sediminis]|uniref:Uncharacterized protein n=1 Tax=Bradymonas sediminis TaxID=1548548 RepID=A0A2Z4FPC5_9DELT|nr:hypothetical protein [Bradymonas sediminis]AWV90849.1 hypothetical protein DN745_16590 [Bradymonas sediminis]TDP75414.1 hypothetical protein DFR33_104281 [Bradymonas sediminis]
MLGEQAKYNQLMTELDEHLSVKAALLLDASGNIRSRVGDARAILKSAQQTAPMVAPGAKGEGLERENIYLVGAGREFLVVIFGEDVQFDGIKTYVDSLLRDLEL